MKRLKAGFTLAETLVTITIMSIVFASMAAGIVVVTRIYQDVTEKANAQTLMSTCIIELTNDLKNAQSVELESNNTLKSFVTDTKGYPMKYVNDDPGMGEVSKGILVQPTNEGSGLKTYPLVTQKTSTEKLYASLTSGVSYKNGIFTFTIKIYGTKGELESQTIDVRPYQVIS